MPELSDPLPSFDKPPVVETALSVQFDPIPGLTNGHLGAFWKSLGPDWPHVEDAPPIRDVFERFGEGRRWSPPTLGLRLQAEPQLRLRIRNQDKTRLIQIQNTRLVHNWIKQPQEEYPRHEQIRNGFESVLHRFKSFLGDERLNEPRSNQWEVTYVNQMEQGPLWSNPSDWKNIFRETQFATSIEGLTQPEGFQANRVFEILPQRGRLHIVIESGHRNAKDRADAIIMKLTARGPLSNVSLLDNLDLGREVIVRMFSDLTTENAHAYWERTR